MGNQRSKSRLGTYESATKTLTMDLSDTEDSKVGHSKEQRYPRSLTPDKQNRQRSPTQSRSRSPHGSRSHSNSPHSAKIIGNVVTSPPSASNLNPPGPSNADKYDDDHAHMYANAMGENEYDYGHVGFREGKIYYAMYDYTAQTDYNLSFKRGDRILVTEQTKPDWWNAMIGLKRGWVPASYLCENTLTLGPWYFKDCTRSDAERLLLEAKPGQFLIRNRDKMTTSSASSIRSEYSLSVKVGEKNVQHYKVEVIHSTTSSSEDSVNARYYIDKRKRFRSLAKLVKFYSRNKDLEVLLTGPCTLDEPTTTGLCIPGLKDKWEIPKEEITFGVILGSGQFGEVWRGRWNNILDVAIKILKSESTMKKEEFLMEARVMKQLHHRHLVQLYAVCSESEQMYIVTELAEHGSLKDFLTHDAGNMGVTFLTGLAGDIAAGMAYLESKDFIHRDLAARNVVVGKNTVCKICDFGLARWLTQEAFYQARRGSKFPVRWTAPEAMLRGKFTTKSDVWSFGILCHEIITKGETPYKGKSNKEVMDFVMKENMLSRPNDCPEWYYTMMTKCWRKDPDTRPSFRHLQKVIHKYSADEIANSLDVSDNE